MWVKICGVTSIDGAVAVASAGADAVGLNFYPKSKRYVRPPEAERQEASGKKQERPSGECSVGSWQSAENRSELPGGETDDCQLTPDDSPPPHSPTLPLAPHAQPAASAVGSHVIAHAREIRDAVVDRIEVVGVFVNSTAAEVATVAKGVGLSAVQFHGDESAELIAEFHAACPDVKIIRAFRIGSEGTAEMDRQIAELRGRNVPLFAVLVDAMVKGEYGGTGHRVNAGALRESSVFRRQFSGNRSDGPPQPAADPPRGRVNDGRASDDCQLTTEHSPPRLILAGGLTPDNVADAIADIQPWGVDTASGVEVSPGQKDPEMMQQFVKAAKAVIV